MYTAVKVLSALCAEFASVLHGIIIDRADVGPPEMYEAFGSEAASAKLTETERFRVQMWDLFDNPSSSTLAQAIASVILFLICVSVLSFMVQTFPWVLMHTHVLHALDIVDYVTVGAFTVELVLRFYYTPDRRNFFLQFLNVIDLFAILPTYIEVAIATAGGESDGAWTTVLRLLRLIRVFRVLKLSRYLTWLRLFATTISASRVPMCLILFVLIVALVVFSSLMYYAEDALDSNPNRTNEEYFRSIPSSAWWGIQTMTTVGFGDAVPETVLGKIVSSLAAICGVIIIAIPISIVASNYTIEFRKLENMQRVLMREEELSSAADATASGGTSTPNGAADAPTPLHWSLPFLHAALGAIKTNRHKLMAGFKQGELRTRDATVAEIAEFCDGLSDDPRAVAAVRGTDTFNSPSSRQTSTSTR
jgi:voltage-gated potassium channel Kch